MPPFSRRVPPAPFYYDEKTDNDLQYGEKRRKQKDLGKRIVTISSYRREAL